MQPSRFDLSEVSEQLSRHASVFANAVSQAHNELIVSQPFNSLEFCHETPPINESSITRAFSSSDVALCAARTRELVCAIKESKNAATNVISSKQRQLLLRAAAVRAKPSKICQVQSQKINNRSKQRNPKSIRPMIIGQGAKPTRSHRRHK
jgi:hypothetical protein